MRKQVRQCRSSGSSCKGFYAKKKNSIIHRQVTCLWHGGEGLTCFILQTSSHDCGIMDKNFELM